MPEDGGTQSPSSPVAVIAGADSELGAAAARLLAAEHCFHVALVGCDPALLDETKLEINANGSQAMVVRADLAEREAPARVVDKVVAEMGRIDTLINTSSEVDSVRFQRVNLSEFNRIVALNLRAPLLLTQRSRPALREAPNAVVVNVISPTLALSSPEQSVCGFTGAALEAPTLELAQTYGPDGIRVNAIRPTTACVPGGGLCPSTPRHRLGPREVAEEAARWIAKFIAPGVVSGAVLTLDSLALAPDVQSSSAYR